MLTQMFLPAALGVLAFWLLKSFLLPVKSKNAPPTVPYLVPFIGSMVTFGMDPLGFLAKQRAKYGDVFTFLMFGRKMTYVLGADGNNFVMNTCKLKEVSAEEAYKYLTVPVFGEGVVYDCPNHMLMDQKKFVKHGLSMENLRLYVQLIEKETREYFAKHWSKDQGIGEAAKALAELTIITASTCLMGKEIRQELDSGTVAELYCDLDKGFTPLNFLFRWLPLESFRRRDRAHILMRDLFMKIMQQRRQSDDMENSDMMQALMDSEYRDGKKMTDREVACMMIALLMAGQHTSSTTATWCISFLAHNPEIRRRLVEEQKQVLGDNLEKPLCYDSLKEMTLLENCVRETLRLRPPIMTIMRKVMEPIQYKDYVINEGDYINVSPALAQTDPAIWGDNASKFVPDRFNDKSSLLSDALGHGAQSSYLPFGAGRHRCIGESFAYIQIKTIIATFIQLFEWERPAGKAFPETDFTTLIVMPIKPVDMVYKRRS